VNFPFGFGIRGVKKRAAIIPQDLVFPNGSKIGVAMKSVRSSTESSSEAWQPA
jgi:hypothetical protein